MRAPCDLGAGELVGGRPALVDTNVPPDTLKVNRLLRGPSQLSLRHLVRTLVGLVWPSYQSLFDFWLLDHGQSKKRSNNQIRTDGLVE